MSHRALLTILCFLFLGSGYARGDTSAKAPPQIATFSIVAYDPATGELGVAVQSKFVAVGAVVPWAKAGVGAIATQAFGNTKYGPKGLKLLASGKSAEETVKILTSKDGLRDNRQLGIVDVKGGSANFTGSRCQSWAGAKKGTHYTVQGNILAGKAVVEAMAKSFEESKGVLAERLIAALEAGQKAGGDKRGRQSAALLVVRKGWGYAGYNDRFRDLRVDDHKTPIQELKRVYQVHRKFLPRPKNVKAPISDITKLKSPWRHAKVGDWARYKSSFLPGKTMLYTITKIEAGQLTYTLDIEGRPQQEYTRNLEDLDDGFSPPESLASKPKVEKKELKTASGTLQCEVYIDDRPRTPRVNWLCRDFPFNSGIVKTLKNNSVTVDLIAWKKNK